MKAYWTSYFDPFGRFVFAETITCNSDTEAIARAQEISLRAKIHEYDIWDGKRLVTRVREAVD